MLDDPQTEVAVLQTFFHEESSRFLLPTLFGDAFTRADRRTLFEALRTLYVSNTPITLLSLDKTTGVRLTPLELVELTTSDKDKYTSIQELEYAITHLKELYFLRKAQKASLKITEHAMKSEIPQIVRVSHAIEKMHSALFHTESQDHFASAVTTVNSPNEYIKTAFPLLNDLVGGFSRKALTSIGGKSGQNKTTWSLYNGTEILKKGIISKLLFISADEPGEMIARRVIAKETDISLSDMRSKKVRLNYDEITKAMKTIYGDRLIILDNVRTPELIQQAILDYKADQTIVDHIQELTFADNDGISEQGITYSLKLFKEAAVKTSSNVIILSQVRDKVIDERFEDKVPRPHDFYYASTMRQKSREQFVVYWKFKDTEDELDKPFFDLILWKSTYSATGRVKFFIDPDHARFREREKTITSTDKPRTEEDIWRTIAKS